MDSLVKIAVDAMGGDYAPSEIIKGVAQALAASEEIFVYLTGNPELLDKELAAVAYPKDRLEVVASTEVIETAEPPVKAIRKKKDSSLVRAFSLVKEKKADALVSAGSTGAILVGGQILVGRIRGIERPALAALIPTKKGVSLLLDSGANVDARASHLVQFAQMGSIYMEHVVGVKDPKVAILNIGAEEEKGNALVKETFPFLKECENIHFTGSIEARRIPEGDADVVVCEAFSGNVVIKMYEGVASVLLSEMKDAFTSSLRSKIGALLVMPALKGTLKTFDASEYGGAPLLGCKGLIVKAHGSAKATEIKNALLQCLAFVRQDINEKIRTYIAEDAVKAVLPEQNKSDEQSFKQE